MNGERPQDENTSGMSGTGGTGPAPIVVHRMTGTRGRRVTIHGQVFGLAHSDTDLVEFLRRAGLPDDAWELLDDPRWVKWQGGRPHEYSPAGQDAEDPQP